MSEHPSVPAAPLSAQPASASWHRFSASEPRVDQAPGDVAVVYGADIPGETELRLIGSVEGRRLLDLGCGAGHAAVAFARQGAKVIAVDARTQCLTDARQLAEREEVRIEVHQADPAELAFLRADTVDVVFSAFALAEVGNLNRVFRQVHRVLKPEAPIVFTLPHPAFAMLDPRAADPLRIVRSYDDPSPISRAVGADEVTDHPRTIAEVFTSLTRANFKVDTLLEPMARPASGRSPWFADVMRHVPATVVFRARKQGN